MVPNSRTWAVALAGYALAGGVVSFAGWALDLPRLADWDDDGIAIQPNAAIAACCAGAALILLNLGWRRAAAALGVLVGLIGGTVVLEYLTGIHLGLDELFLFDRTWGRIGVLVPGRMGPPGSVSWTLIGAAILLATRGPQARTIAPKVAALPLAIASLSLIGYLYGADLLYTLPRLTIIALQTGTFIAAVSAAVILSVPEHAPMRQITEDGVAGTLIRRALPVIILMPILLGLLRLVGEWWGLFDASFGSAARTVFEIALMLGLLWWTASVIRRQARRAAERERAAMAVDHRLASVLGSLSDPFVTFTADWSFSFVNDVATEVLRRPHERLLGRNVWEEFPEAVGTTSYVQLQRAMGERIAVEYETFYEPWRRWFYVKAYPAADGGLALFFRDVTEQKSTHEALQDSRKQLEADLVAITRIQRLSNQLVPADELSSHLDQILMVAAEITGTDKGNIQLFDRGHDRLRLIAHRGYGRRFIEHFGLRGAAEIWCAAASRLERLVIEDVKHDAALAGCEDRDVLLDDGIRAVVSTPLVARDGRVLGVFNNQFRFPHRPSDHVLRYVDLLARMTSDVVERSIIEQALKDSERSARTARGEAERANAVKDEFLATLSHELRSPLNAILGWVRILEKRPADSKLTNEGIDVISRNAKAQSDLIADLLDMNRILSGKVRLEIENVGLSDVIREAIDTMRPAAESKQIRVEPILSPSADAVRGDPARLQQVMCNLLSNAVKFTPKGGRVQVTLSKSGSQADIVVSDTGSGIHPKFLPHVFDRFRQGDASTTREQGGLGLGLAIVKQLVELHGGTARAESPGEGRGATFTVSFPLALTHVVQSPESTESVSPRNAEEVDLSGITILAVEDQPDARELLRVVLERCHAQVLTAGSADEALRLLDSARPDIILCDVGMPGKDGYEFIVELRKRQNLTPALAVTAFARTEDKVRALRAGFHAHVAKPIEPAELLSTVAVFARAVRH